MYKDNYCNKEDQLGKNGYSLSRQMFEFSRKNPGLVKPKHFALYFWIVELNNKLQWREVFGLPTLASMKMVGMKDRRSYRRTFNDLESWGFIKKIRKSLNQYHANTITLLLKNDEKESWNNQDDIGQQNDFPYTI